jgi:hypothetical protein
MENVFRAVLPPPSLFLLALFCQSVSLPASADLLTTPGGWPSWEQPDSWGPGGWEGQCGQTSIANLLYLHCGIAVPPEQIPDLSAWCNDLGPGTDPLTYLDCINRINNCGKWGFCTPPIESGSNPILWLHSQLVQPGGGPVALLINPNCGGAMHWITVVSVTGAGTPGCMVTYLEYGTETTVGCTWFEAQWALNCSLVGVGAQVYGIPPYTAICQSTPPNILVDQPPSTPIPGAVTVGCFAGDQPHDIWQRCRNAWRDWVVVNGTLWDTTCADIWADTSIGANDWRWQACQNLVNQCIADTNAVCAAAPAAPPGPPAQPAPVQAVAQPVPAPPPPPPM